MPALPLVNIVFLLLVFFMAAGRRAPPDPVARAPAASTHTGVDLTPPITLAFSANGQVFLSGGEPVSTGYASASPTGWRSTSRSVRMAEVPASALGPTKTVFQLHGVSADGRMGSDQREPPSFLRPEFQLTAPFDARTSSDDWHQE